MKPFFTLLFLFLSNLILAQNGKITGKVISSRTGEPLIGATVNIEGSNRNVTSDLNGNYSISGLAPKTYALVVSYVSYAKKIVEEVVLKAGDAVVVNISLVEANNASIDVIVTRTRVNRENTASLLTTQKNSASVSDGISAEIIRKTPDRTTSDVLKRVSGASIQDDRFAIIRGLNDRYNAAFINGAPLPSSESDRKAFAFDIFPANILDNLVIYKTATPDVTGDFAGGIINIITKSIPTKNFTQIAFSTGYNSMATFKQKITGQQKSKYDLIGLDDGGRQIPDGLPSSKDLITKTAAERAEYAKLFSNYKWGLDTGKASPNLGFQLSKGITFEKKGKEFIGLIMSLTYNKNNTYTEGERNNYEYDITNPANIPIWRGKYTDRNYITETLLGVLANFSVKLSPKSSISWKNIYSINSDNRIATRSGNPDFEADPNVFENSSVRWFTSNQIYTTQLAGEHAIGTKNTKISWLGSFANVLRDIPNMSSFYRVGDLADLQTNFTSQTPNQLMGGSMFFSKNKESIYSGKIDIVQPFKLFSDQQSNLKAGVAYQKRVRDFSARILGFEPYQRGSVNFDNTLYKLDQNNVFNRENLGRKANGQGGFILADGNLPQYDYDASSELKAAYLMADQRILKNFRLIYGVRLEHFNQQLNSFLSFNKPTNINTTVTDYLPSANLVYSLSSKQNIRLGYSKTVNRPEFREMAPFNFYDFAAQYTIGGYDSIRRATIKNYDFRYEFYPGKSQLLSVSVFYKDFKDPIEILAEPVFDNLAIYSNSVSARVYGVEAEFRIVLGSLFKSPENGLLNQFTIAANGALMWSDVKLGRYGFYDLSNLVQDRALQGQSPYLINSSLSYANDKLGISSTVSYNRVGPRVFIAGTLSDADIYEQTRDVIDFQLAKFFINNKLECKFNIRDLLAQDLLFYYDINKNKTYEVAGDRPFSNRKMPKTFSLSFSYKF